MLYWKYRWRMGFSLCLDLLKIDYIAENYGEVVKTDSAVKRFCKKHNITFSGLE